MEGILNIRTLDKKYSEINRLEKAFEAHRLAKLLYTVVSSPLYAKEAIDYFAKYYEEDLEQIKTNEFLINKINNSKLDFDGNYKYFHIIKFNDRIQKFFSFEEVPIIGFISETEVPYDSSPLGLHDDIPVEKSYINKTLWMLGTYYNLNTPYQAKDSSVVLAKEWPGLRRELYDREAAATGHDISEINLDNMLTNIYNISLSKNLWKWPDEGIKTTILKPYKCGSTSSKDVCGMIKLNKKNLVIVWAGGLSDEIPLDSIVICNYINSNKEVDYNSFCFKYDNTEYIFSLSRKYNTAVQAQSAIAYLKFESELSKVVAQAAVAKRQCVVKGEKLKEKLHKITLTVGRNSGEQLGITFVDDTSLPKVVKVAGNAASAGLQIGDYIHKVNDTDVFCTGDFKKEFSNPQALEFKVHILREAQPEEQAGEQVGSGSGIETDDSGNDSDNDSDNESSLLKIRPYRSETESSDHSDWSSEWSDSEED